MKFSIIRQIALFFISFSATVVLGQEALSPDRPNATGGTHVMEVGVLQLELGYNSSELNAAPKAKSSGLGAMIRFGLFENFEVRLDFERSKFTLDPSFENSDLSPITIGFKTHLKEEGTYCPNISFLGTLTLKNTGSSDFEALNHAPSFRFLLEKGINDSFGLGANIGMEWNGFDPGATIISTVVLGVSLTDWLGSFFEIESYYLSEIEDEHIFNFGFTVWLESNVQLDFGYGVGISEAALENQMTLGVSTRLFK